MKIGRKLTLEFTSVGRFRQLTLVKFVAAANEPERLFTPSEAGGWGSTMMGFALLILEYKCRGRSNGEDCFLEIPTKDRSPLRSLCEELEKQSWIWQIFAKTEHQQAGEHLVDTIFHPNQGDYRHGKKGKYRRLRIRGTELRNASVTIVSNSKPVTDKKVLERLVTEIWEEWKERFGKRSEALDKVSDTGRTKNHLSSAPFFQTGTFLKLLGEEIYLPDLLTPGSSWVEIERAYQQIIGPERSRLIADCWSSAIKAVADGDFSTQEATGRTIAQICDDEPRIKGVGLYLAAEGVRLQGDLELDGQKRRNLYEKAAELYQEAGMLTPEDPRPYRGLARIDEHEGRLDLALRGFQNAEALLQATLALRKGSGKLPFIAHEHLRILRHKIHCILQERSSPGTNEWNLERRSVELEGMVAQCDRLHDELMPLFSEQPKWFKIEWFMGLVFLAKAYSSLRRPDLMVQKLLHALSARRSMLAHDVPLSIVDYANLQWWCSITGTSPVGPNLMFAGLVERLREALRQRDEKLILDIIDALVRCDLPPWKRNGG